jgi:hypothetical protein
LSIADYGLRGNNHGSELGLEALELGISHDLLESLLNTFLDVLWRKLHGFVHKIFEFRRFI